jgi:hypothetical protein
MSTARPWVLVWDSSTRGTLRNTPMAAPPVAPKPTAKKKPQRALSGLRWTNRLKRYGGLQGLEGTRLRHFQLLAEVPASKRSAADKELAKGAFEWLRENPLRVLPKLTLAFFGWL